MPDLSLQPTAWTKAFLWKFSLPEALAHAAGWSVRSTRGYTAQNATPPAREPVHLQNSQINLANSVQFPLNSYSTTTTKAKAKWNKKFHVDGFKFTFVTPPSIQTWALRLEVGRQQTANFCHTFLNERQLLQVGNKTATAPCIPSYQEGNTPQGGCPLFLAKLFIVPYRPSSFPLSPLQNAACVLEPFQCFRLERPTEQSSPIPAAQPR